MSIPVAISHGILAVLGVRGLQTFQIEGSDFEANLPGSSYLVTSIYSILGVCQFGAKLSGITEIYQIFFTTQACLCLPFISTSVMRREGWSDGIRRLPALFGVLIWGLIFVDSGYTSLIQTSIVVNSLLMTYIWVNTQQFWHLSTGLSPAIAYLYIFKKGQLNENDFVCFNLLLSLFTYSSVKALTE